MKQLINLTSYKSFVAVLTLAMIQFSAMAQDSASAVSKSSTTTSSTESTFVQPWVWIVGAVVLLIIILLLVRGNNSTTTGAGTTDKVTYTKKVSREDNV